jgi:hypothetical protein
MHSGGYHAIAFHSVVAHATCRSVFRAPSSEHVSMCIERHQPCSCAPSLAGFTACGHSARFPPRVVLCNV